MAVSAPDPIEEQHLLLHQRVAVAQAERFIRMGDETAQVLKTTFDNATRSYKAITYMCIAMFSVGLSIFTISSVYGIFFTDNRGWALAFSGMGAGTFIAVFVTGAIRKTQTALSNLVQVDIAFMNFFEQITLWDNYAGLPEGDPPRPDPTKFEQASKTLQARSAETMELVQKFTETEADDS